MDQKQDQEQIMSVPQALAILEQATEMIQTTRTNHMRIAHAIETLRVHASGPMRMRAAPEVKQAPPQTLEEARAASLKTI